MKFDQVVGMMKAYELKMKKKDLPVDKGVALTAANNQQESLEDAVGLIARKFFKKFEKGQRNASSSNNTRFQKDKEEKKSEKQCAECEGYGHFKTDCPTIKRRSTLQCYECKGYGHTKTDCLGLNNSKNKSYVTWSESDSEEEDGADVLNNFMAHLGIIEEGTEDQEAESEDEDINMSIDEQLMVLVEDSMTKKGEIQALTAENEKLTNKVSRLEKELSDEKQKNLELSRKIEDQLKNVRMLNSGTKELEKVLNSGRTSNVSWGLGYQGGSVGSTTKFVKGSSQNANGNSSQQINESRRPNSRSAPTTSKRMDQQQNRRQSVYLYGGGRVTGCWYCGKPGHYKANCYRYLNKIKQAIFQHRYYQSNKQPSQVWIRKEDLYCNMAMISEESTTCNAEEKWFFDSGCSQHMTGNEQLLRGLEFSSSRRVILGDGSHCVIRGQGMTTDANQPALEKVQLVEGLRANLISISRLCDDGCEVAFTNSTCKVIDAQGKVKFTGLRTDNYCYEWISNKEEQRVEDDDNIIVDTATCRGVWGDNPRGAPQGDYEVSVVQLQGVNLSSQVLTGEIQGESSAPPTAEVSTSRQPVITGPQQFSKQETVRTNWQNIMQDEIRQLRTHGSDADDVHWRNSPRLTVTQDDVIRRTYLMAQGYEEVEGVFLDELFPPMSFLDTIKFLVGAACVLNAKLYRLDVATSEQGAYHKMMTTVLDHGYTKGSVNKSLFTQLDGQNITIVYLNGSHLVGLATCQAKIELLFTVLSQQADVGYHGELNEIFGLQIQQLEEGIIVTQSEYIRELVMRFSVKTDSSVRTPISRRWNYVPNEETVDSIVYLEMLGSLNFVTATRPDVVFAVDMCSKHQDAPNVYHFKAIKRVLKYLKGTMDWGLYFNKHTDGNLSGYASAYRTRILNEHRNVCGGCFFLGDNLVSWYSKTRSALVSSTENNSAAVGVCASHLVRLNQLINECGMFSSTPSIHCDDRSAVNVSVPEINSTKHINVFDEYVHAQIVANKVVVRPVSNVLQLSDLLSRPLLYEQLTFLRQAVGLIEL